MILDFIKVNVKYIIAITNSWTSSVNLQISPILKSPSIAGKITCWYLVTKTLSNSPKLKNGTGSILSPINGSITNLSLSKIWITFLMEINCYLLSRLKIDNLRIYLDLSIKWSRSIKIRIAGKIPLQKKFIELP